MPMDMKILAQVREQAAATDDLKAELSTAQQEREELRRQLAAVQQENERLRKQAGKMARIEQEFAEIKRLITESQQAIKRDLINEWAVTVAPHMKTTNREVQELREQHQALKESLSEMLEEFEGRTKGTAENITKLFTEQVNAGWTVVHNEHERARAVLKRLHSVNDEKLKAQEAAVNKLLEEIGSYDEHFVDLYNSALELSKTSTQMSSKLDAAVTKFEKLTSDTIQEVADTAKQTITETRAAAINDINKARTRAVHVLTGFENRFVDHPVAALLAVAMMLVVGCTVIGALIGPLGSDAAHERDDS